jgi:eukaryotic-like serine/threonine-protein kinase
MIWKKAVFYSLTPLLVFLLAFYVTVNVLLKRGEDVVCPDVRGKELEEAKRLVQSKGLSMNVVRYEKRRDVAFNHITVQKPEADIPTRKGRTVLVVVSEGPPLVEVPAVTGLSREGAEEMLSAKGLRIEKTISVPAATEGNVVAQIPKAGENVLEGRGVVVLLGSRRTVYYLMPDIGDFSVSEISEELETRKIRYKLTYTRAEHIFSTAPIKASVLPKSIFDASDEVEIKINYGG